MWEQLKAGWKKRGVKNVVFLAILALLFFTDLGQWLRIHVTGITLSAPENEIANDSTANPESLVYFPFQIVSAAGDTTMLSQLVGEPMFISFWASWCVPCLAEFPSMQHLQEEMPNVQFVFISGEDKEAFEKYVDKSSHAYPFYRQLSKTPHQLNHEVIPASFLVDENGKVVFKHLGAADWEDESVVNELKSLLN